MIILIIAVAAGLLFYLSNLPKTEALAKATGFNAQAIKTAKIQTALQAEIEAAFNLDASRTDAVAVKEARIETVYKGFEADEFAGIAKPLVGTPPADAPKGDALYYANAGIYELAGESGRAIWADRTGLPPSQYPYGDTPAVYPTQGDVDIPANAGEEEVLRRIVGGSIGSKANIVWDAVFPDIPFGLSYRTLHEKYHFSITDLTAIPAQLHFKMVELYPHYFPGWQPALGYRIPL